jgi:E3 ubiquitin-protein ligase SIAH1
MENAMPKKPRTLRKSAVAKKEQQQQHDEGEEPRTLNVTLNLDALECPLCFSPFGALIFQASRLLLPSSKAAIQLRLQCRI